MMVIGEPRSVRFAPPTCLGVAAGGVVGLSFEQLTARPRELATASTVNRGRRRIDRSSGVRWWGLEGAKALSLDCSGGARSSPCQNTYLLRRDRVCRCASCLCGTRRTVNRIVSLVLIALCEKAILRPIPT